ncbi:mannose-6-phosphate isomerase, class I [Microbacterium sp.]|uniref:mannose-6-phosphate isomerase, class I n=1 Tax=Microbacterium sp. TaxID=51671 RepID=UPI00373656BE
MTAQVTKIVGPIRDYAWGTTGGISRVLGAPETDAVEAELWLGAHPSAPSRAAEDGSAWADLAEWEASGAGRVPYLMKVLSAASPLSLQAHPTPDQAAEGFERENAAGIPLDARERNYKDPFAKPELIVALEDGYEALCGFRPLAQTRALADALAGASGTADVFAPWQQRLAGEDGVRAAFEWLLGGGRDVADLVSAVVEVAAGSATYELADRLAQAYPGDPGIVVALMLNHVTLAAGESLWLPAGNIHAYLRGTGMELMGPSDNVLRGGLTPKHVDIAELSRVLDFSDGEPPYLVPIEVSENVRTYRPRTLPTGREVPFELLEISGDAAISTGSPSIALVVDGALTLTVGGADVEVARGEAVFVADAAQLTWQGRGRAFVATA